MTNFENVLVKNYILIKYKNHYVFSLTSKIKEISKWKYFKINGGKYFKINGTIYIPA